MPTLEELLRYKYGDSQSPEDILRRLESINLQNKKNAKAIPTAPAGDRIVPTQEDDSPYGKLERGIFEGLQKYGPSTFQDPYRANQTAGALTDVLSMTPGPAEIMDHRQGNYLMEEGRPVAGLGYQAMAALPFIPANRVRRAIPDDMGGGGPPVTPKVERMPIATDYKVDMKLGPKGSYEPKVMSLAAEAVVKAPGFEFNKAYPIEEMINKMSKYHNPTKGKGPANPKVQRQFETFVSPEFKAKGKATPKELQEEIQKNQMRFQENHTQFDMNERPRVVVDSGRPEGIPDENQYPTVRGFEDGAAFGSGQDQLTGFRTGKAYPDSVEDPIKYGELNLQVFGAKYGDEGIFNDEYYQLHTRVGQGPYVNPDKDMDSLTNRITHGRYRIAPKEGRLIGELSESQSDRFRFDGDGTQNLQYSNEGTLNTTMTYDDAAAQTRSIRSDFETVAPDFINTVGAVTDLGGFTNPNAILNQFSSDLAEVISDIPPTTIFDPKTTKKIFKEVIDNFDDFFVELGEAGINGREFTKYYDAGSFEGWKKGMLDSLDSTNPEVMTALLTRMKGSVRSQFPKAGGGPLEKLKLPLSEKNEWYDLQVKRFIQEMHQEGNVEAIHIPINGYAVYKQMGKEQVDSLADNLGKTYKNETKRVLKNIEKEYGFKIQPKVVQDDFGQQFYEIELNNDTRKIQEVLKYNIGGSVKAGSSPLMNLKYT